MGGGPAGLTAALVLKLRDPRREVTVFERSVSGAARGYGVSLWRDSLEKLESVDPESAREIELASYCWDTHVVEVDGEQLVYAADRGYGITRQRLTDILARRALAAGANLECEREVTSAAQLPDFDLVLGCDGVNSRIRQAATGFRTDMQVGRSKYLWLGTDKYFPTFIYSFVQTDFGWIWAGAHSCGARAEEGTFIVECSAETWAGLGFHAMPLDDCLLVLEKLFAHHLRGRHLIGRSYGEADAQWHSFRTITNRNWYDGNAVLVGDAAHTTHFSIGSGTKLAIEDAIALADNLGRHADIQPALQAYQAERQVAILPNQITARLSGQFFESIPRYIELKPRQFVTLLRRRRSPLLPYLPPRLGYLLYPTSRDIPFLRRSGRWVARGGIRIYNWLNSVRPRAGPELVRAAGETVRITCVGGGPTGLYFALLMKLHDSRHDITVLERNAPGVTRGWGVVFWQDLLAELYDADPESAREIEQQSFRWDNQVLEVRGHRVSNTGVRGFGINRQRLLDILVRRAQGAGVRIEFGHAAVDVADLPGADLVVASDGVNSRVRSETGGFGTDSRVGRNKYIWLGTDKVFSSFTFPFVETQSGWLWAHTYGIDPDTSTFIVECSAETYQGLGFETMSPEGTLSQLEQIFEQQLDGHRLMGQRPDGADVQWLNFRTVTNEHWYRGRTVLAGDAAHTTHFTIGSGTKLAVEDAIALTRSLQRHPDLEAGLAAYQRQRQQELLQPQSEANFSAQWFENIPRYIDLKPEQFFALLRERRSPLLPRLSPQLYYRLHHTTQTSPLLREVRNRVGPKAREIYSRRGRARSTS